MRKILSFIILLGLVGAAAAQDPNPQTSWSSAVLYNSPSLYLNYNDPTSAFKDQVSGNTFVGTQTVQGVASAGTHCISGNNSASSMSCTLSVSATDTLVVIVSGTVSSVVDSGGSTPVLIATEPTASAYYFANVSAGSHTITVTLTTVQSYISMLAVDVVGAAISSPLDTYVYNVQTTSTNSVTSGSLTTSTAGDLLVGMMAGNGAGGTWSAGSPAFSLFPIFYTDEVGGTYAAGTPGSYTFNATSSVALGWDTWLVAIKAHLVTDTSGTVTTQQPGFDATNNANYSASFPYNGWTAAPNTTLGAIDWTSPFSIMVQVDRLNWNRTGTLVLASKGDTSGSTNYWKLYLQMSGTNSQLCFNQFGIGPINAPSGQINAGVSTCTSVGDVMPNGYNYNIVVENPGTGNSYAGAIYIDGISQSLSVGGIGNTNRFGYATIALSGTTSGYANPTWFSNNGTGGPNCNVFGQAVATSGVLSLNNPISGQAPNGFYSADYGCTSTPTLTFNFSQTSPVSYGGVSGTPTSTSSTTATSVTIGVGSGVVAGSALIVQGLPPSTTGVTDSGGATCTLVSGASGLDTLIYVCPNVAAGTHTLTATYASGAAFQTINTVAVAGADHTSPVDTAIYATGTGTAVNVGPITTASAGEMLVSTAGTSIGNSWYTYQPWYNGSGNNYTYSYLAAPTVGSQPAFVTAAGSSAAWTASIVAIKPLITTYAPTGTGATLTAAMSGASMNDTTHPLLAPGSLNADAYYGIAGTNSAAPGTYIDEFAIFPSVLNFTQVSSLFYHTKLYQSVLYPEGVSPKYVIFDEDGCGDEDNFWALQAVIAAQNVGLIHLVAVIQESATDATSAAIYRNMLDQAGLANIPVGLGTSSYGCSLQQQQAAQLYNASVPITTASYPSATTVYRTAFAQFPNTALNIFLAATQDSIAAFMASPADGISSLTGLQMWNNDATLGAGLYMQGGGCTPTIPPASPACTGSGGWQSNGISMQYIVNNKGSMPFYWMGGTPSNTGPGPLYTRNAYDPMYQFAYVYGTDIRAGWDSLALSYIISPFFSGGIMVGYSSGGTGYANQTLFTSSGGGPNCHVTGYMTAASGVPNGVTDLQGNSATVQASSFAQTGIGYGCTSVPTLTLVSPTGTGATLTGYMTTFCGTETVTGTGPYTDSFSSATCSGSYIVLQNFNAHDSNGFQPFTGVFNSFIDPPPNGAPRKLAQ